MEYIILMAEMSVLFHYKKINCLKIWFVLPFGVSSLQLLCHLGNSDATKGPWSKAVDADAPEAAK